MNEVAPGRLLEGFSSESPLVRELIWILQCSIQRIPWLYPFWHRSSGQQYSSFSCSWGKVRFGGIFPECHLPVLAFLSQSEFQSYLCQPSWISQQYLPVKYITTNFKIGDYCMIQNRKSMRYIAMSTILSFLIATTFSSNISFELSTAYIGCSNLPWLCAGLWLHNHPTHIFHQFLPL